MEPEKAENLLASMVSSLEAEARTNGYNLYDSSVSWRTQWAKSANRLVNRLNTEEVCCPSCGKSTGLKRAFHMVIPKDGLKCSSCDSIVIYGTNLTL